MWDLMFNLMGIPIDELITEETVPKDFFFSNFQHECMNAYLRCSPDMVFPKINEHESNKEILEEEIGFLLQMFIQMERYTLNNTTMENKELFQQLIKKYDIDLQMQEKEKVNPILMRWAFPIIFFNISKDNLDFKYNCSSELMNEYKNFLIPLQNVGILGILPKNKKYGGYVKALYNVILKQYGRGRKHEPSMAYLKSIYHSKVIPQSKREQLFAQFNITEEDCIEWSKVFDAKFPDYKEMHKFFEQIA